MSKPSEKSIEYATKIATALELGGLKYLESEGLLEEQTLISDFIDNHKEEYFKTFKPSDKQISFAEKIAEKVEVDLPENYKEQLKICSDFIEEYKVEFFEKVKD